MTEAARALSGALEGGVHVLPVRVYYEDTDAGGIVYHANYLRWAERARTEMMRLLGTEHRSMAETEGTIFAVRRCSVEFDRPARLDDLLRVRSRILAVRGATIDIEQIVESQDRDMDAAPAGRGAQVRISLTLCCLNRDGRPVRLPAAVGRALEALAAAAEGGRD
ncbi:YbgC/FadM family acyl-CoA thioesterase [Arenibaculum pallidiluteum]|uniref:YbgC/FadM family acyl-CoA thioesterase n=1 Tax=Arenibaculum pallidiluteum TaxID=2812559 RepID=UPI001F390C4D|nr:YbgC/FadM family acyl-CoA thioesterase [Arenibaculum pallidiluteum]